jgi:23S rRNA maturation-related 3'-5' exoribonuclease YhaM
MDALHEYYEIIDKNICSGEFKKLIKDCIEPKKDKFCSIPVSISFHGEEAGLDGSNLNHIIRVLKIAVNLRPILEKAPYNINYDHLLTALALHDIGKIMCYSKENDQWKYFGIDSKSHPAIGADLIKRQALKNNIEITPVTDAIETHYGPFGNKMPESPLAWCVHLIEMIDTKSKF